MNANEGWGVRGEKSMGALDPVRLGVAAGVLSGFFIFVATLVSVVTGHGSAFLEQISQYLPGYSVSVAGSLVGLVYGFIKGFLGLFLLGYVYNLLGPRRD